MKRKLFALITSFVLAMTLVGCGGGKDMSNSPYVGNWTATKASMSGIEIPVSSAIGGEMTLELKDNGKCVMDMAGDTTTCDWDETDRGFEIKDSKDSFELVVDGKNAQMEYEGITFSFVQK